MYSASGLVLSNFVTREQEHAALTLMISLRVKMLHEFVQHASQRRSPNRISLDKHSCLAERIQRSA